MKKQPIPTEAAFQSAVSKYSAHIPLIQKLEAEKAVVVQKAAEKFDERIAESQRALEGVEDTITRFAQARRQALLPADGKSIRFGNVEMGWRTGQPTLKPCEDTNWEAATALIKRKLPDCIRVKEELNKVLIKQLIAIPGKDAKLIKACGLQLVSEETFFVKLKD